MEVEFERDALFIEVWQTPMSKLSKKYGMSDSGLRKVCLALAIPLPRQGHWAKNRGWAPDHNTLTPTSNR